MYLFCLSFTVGIYSNFRIDGGSDRWKCSRAFLGSPMDFCNCKWEDEKHVVKL